VARHKLRRRKRGLKTGSSRPVRSAPWKGDLCSANEGASDQISRYDFEGLLWVRSDYRMYIRPRSRIGRGRSWRRQPVRRVHGERTRANMWNRFRELEEVNRKIGIQR